MLAVIESRRPRRGEALLLSHCSTLAQPSTAERAPAAERLEQQVGSRLAELLVRALGRRGARSALSR